MRMPTLSPRTSLTSLWRAGFWLLACSLLGCESEGPRVYTAQPYDVEAMCLGDYEPIGLVSAEDLPGTCDPVCLRLDEVLYLSTVCAPYPDTTVLETPEESEECAAGLAALETGAYCELAEEP
jgi:hypothetical protein